MIADKPEPLLRIENLTAHYGAAQALFGVDLAVAPGETVALVGANGAGKTSLLKAVMGLAPPSGGRIWLDGVEVTGSTPAAMAARGVALCPEGREMFGDLTVQENLELGALALGISRPEMARRLAAVAARFPKLKERAGQRTNTLSGGEQQMVAMGRALMAQPRLLLLDEPSLGLAPLITDEIFDIIKQLARGGVTILLVEQNAARALTASRSAYLLANGRIVGQGRSDELLVDPDLRRAFLGAGSDHNPAASRLGGAGLTNIRLEKPNLSKQTFMPSFKTEDELRAHQLAGLKWTVRHAFEGSSFYRAHLDGAGVSPDDIRSLDDLQKLPLTTGEDLRDGYPFGFRSVPFEQIVRIHASSGTTGKRKILCYTGKDVADWRHFFARAYEMAGVTPLDRVQIAVGYGVWTAGVGFQAGVEALGAMALPVGPGNVDLHCEFLVDLQSTVLCCTASMGLLMAEEVNQRGLADKINLKKVIYGSERSSVSMRRKISEPVRGRRTLRHPRHDGTLRAGDRHRVPGPRLHPLLGRLLYPGNPGPGDPDAGPRRRVGGDGGHHPEQGGRAPDPLPHPGHYPDHPGALHLRRRPAPAFPPPGPHRRHVQVPGGEHLSFQRRPHPLGGPGPGLRVPGSPGPGRGRPGPHAPQGGAGRRGGGGPHRRTGPGGALRRQAPADGDAGGGGGGLRRTAPLRAQEPAGFRWPEYGFGGLG